MSDEKTEAEFKKWLRKHWEGAGRWMGSVEYAIGGDDGFADLVMLVDGGEFVPAELKVGKIDNGVIIPREVRSAQVIWHREAWAHGGRTYLLVGIPVARRDDWVVFGIEGDKISSWRDGWRIGADVVGLSTTPGNDFVERVNDYLAGRIEP